MKKTALAFAVMAFAFQAVAAAAPQSPPLFDEFFLDKALRIDLYQFGDARSETVTVHRIFEEPIWPESKTGLLPPFDYGRYVFKVYDAASNRLIFSRGFDTHVRRVQDDLPGARRDGPRLRALRQVPRAQAPGPLRHRAARQAQPPPSRLQPRSSIPPTTTSSARSPRAGGLDL